MNVIGWLGAWVAVLGLGIVILELLMVVPRLRRLTKRLNQLTLLVEQQQRLTNDELKIFQRSSAQRLEILRPYRRFWRWFRHPLTLALIQSYWRRRAVASERS